MAINIWNAGGQPTSFNPLPASISITALPIGEYEISFRAKSDSNAVLRVTDNANFSYVHERTLTPIMTEYKIALNQKKENRFYLFDMSNRNDIIIENINLVGKPYGKATINGVDGFGTIKEGFTGKLSTIADFKGKVLGSATENPHRANRAFRSKLDTIDLYNTEIYQAQYDSINKLDSTIFAYGTTTSTHMAQHIFSFNIIAEVERQIGIIPASTIAEKVQWIKNNINKFQAYHYGYGSSVGGNKLTLNAWRTDLSAWNGTFYSHTSSIVTKIGYSTQSPSAYIDSNGFVSFIAYAEPSDGVTGSYINTDYMELGIEMKQEAVVDSKWTFHPNVRIIDDTAIEISSSTTFQAGNELRVPCEPNTEYTMMHDFVQDCGIIIAPLQKDGTSTGTGNIQGGGFIRGSFVTPSNANFLRLAPMNRYAGTYVLRNVSMNKGGSNAPYTKKTGERMVIPSFKKNLLPSITTLFNTSGDKHVYSDYRIEIDATPQITIGYYNVSVKPNTDYVFSAEYEGEPTCAIYNEDATQSIASYSQSDLVFNSGQRTKLRVYFRLAQGLKGAVKNYQLEEGTKKTSFEPCEVDVSPKANKQMKSIYKPVDFGIHPSAYTYIDDYSFKIKGSYWYTEGIKIPVNPNTEYTYSFRQEVISGGACWTNILLYNDSTLIGETSYTANITSGVTGKTFTTPSNCNYIVMRVARSGTSRSYEVNYYDFRFGLKSETENRIAFNKPKNLAQKSDFMENVSGLARPLTAYGGGGYSISDDVFIPNTKSQRAVWTSTANDGVAMLNRGLRVTLSDPEFSNLTIGDLCILSFYGKGWEQSRSEVSWYSVNTANNAPLSREDVGNGWYRYSYRFRYLGKEGAYIYMRPNYNFDYSYDILMNGLQIEVSSADKPSPYSAYKPRSKPSLKGLSFDGRDDYLLFNNSSFLDLTKGDFTVESSFTWNGANAINASQQTLFSCGDIRYGISSVGIGQIGIYTPASGWVAQTALKVGEKVKLKTVFTPTSVSIFINDKFLDTKTYSGTIASNTSIAYIGNLSGGSYFFNGLMHTMKVVSGGTTLIDIDFENPKTVLGSSIIGKTNIIGDIKGNPTQQLKLAKR